MTWFQMREEALKAGELVYSFNQSVAPQAAFAGKFDSEADIKSGYCLGLAVQWIVLRLQGKDYPYSPNRALSPSLTYVASSDHATFAKCFREGKGSLRNGFFGIGAKTVEELDESSLNVALAAYKLKHWSPAAIRTGGPDPDFLLGAARERRGLAVIIWRSATAAHATAIDARIAEQRFNYFDANFGHFQIQGVARFIGWFNRYMEHSGYKSYDKSQGYYVLGLA